MATEAAIPINTPRDTVQRIHRTTRENRSLWYQLTVLQQPERARACGAGSKAHSDRRPVDPPPVVELRIIEGETAETGRDITFDYNANFFLFASLEHARPIAQGRVAAPNQGAPCLTGVPCSGMAYLDRPISAGYFIFPDLSIRHEGNYFINFHLYEQTKEEKDWDLGAAPQDMPEGSDFRMAIKTNAFQVFSAKKFPGLMESTQLSKTVADQGCRVRIRRDVRMRKRDGKGGNNYRDRGDGDFAARQPKAVSPAPEDPHAAAHRQRAQSNASEHQQRHPYAADHRRPSAADGYVHAPPPPPPPGYETAAPASRSHHPYADSSANGYSRGSISHSGPQLAPVSPGGPYTSTGTSTPTYPAYQPIRPLSRAGPGSVAPMGQDAHDRRMSLHHPPPSPSVYSSMDPNSRRDSMASYPSTPASTHTPHMSLPNNGSAGTGYRGHAPLKIAALVTPLPAIEPQTEPEILPPPVYTGGKRKHDYSFQQSTTPLHNGQRQQDPHFSDRQRGLSCEPKEGSYHRSDGTLQYMSFPKYYQY